MGLDGLIGMLGLGKDWDGNHGMTGTNELLAEQAETRGIQRIDTKNGEE